MKDQRNKTSIIFTILFSLCRDMKNLRFFYALEVAYCTVERNFNQRHSARDYISWMRNFIRKLPSLCIPCKHDLAIQKREINISLIERARERERERERESADQRVRWIKRARHDIQHGKKERHRLKMKFHCNNRQIWK